MSDDTGDRVALVRKAAASSLTNCFDWLDDKVVTVVSRRRDLLGLTPTTIKRLAREWISTHNGAVFERVENRPVGIDRRDFWYFILIPVDPLEDFPRGLFVEMELTDADSDLPEVSLLNAHPQLEGPRLSSGGTFLS